jgi:hypothetical protein
MTKVQRTGGADSSPIETEICARRTLASKHKESRADDSERTKPSNSIVATSEHPQDPRCRRREETKEWNRREDRGDEAGQELMETRYR